MIFSEIYGSYFNAAAKILSRAVDGRLTEKDITEIVENEAFGESILNLPAKIKSDGWGLITSDLKTPIKHKPRMPLTLLQKRWLKTIMDDPRFELLEEKPQNIDNIEPLYKKGTIVYFDRYTDGDPYDDDSYIKNFQTVLKATGTKSRLSVKFKSRTDVIHNKFLMPHRIEYSSQDDKFRLIAASKHRVWTINIARIIDCSICEDEEAVYVPIDSKTEHMKEVVIELTDERNALERAMMQFSYLEKKTERIDCNRYRITLRYDKDDETELLIRIIAFGPVIKVTEPEDFKKLICERLLRQKNLNL